MTKWILFGFFACTFIPAVAQKGVVRGYAYVQHSIPGVAPRGRTAEGGGPVQQKAKTGSTYNIYLEYRKGQVIKPIYIWIEGKAFSVQHATVRTPVTLKRQDEGNRLADTLVAQTPNKVLRVQPTGKVSRQNGKHGAKENNIVVAYNWRGKTYYCTIHEIKELPASILQ